jgi:hypothetical protein
MTTTDQNSLDVAKVESLPGLISRAAAALARATTAAEVLDAKDQATDTKRGGAVGGDRPIPPRLRLRRSRRAWHRGRTDRWRDYCTAITATRQVTKVRSTPFPLPTLVATPLPTAGSASGPMTRIPALISVTTACGIRARDDGIVSLGRSDRGRDRERGRRRDGFAVLQSQTSFPGLIKSRSRFHFQPDT